MIFVLVMLTLTWSDVLDAASGFTPKEPTSGK
jgi:hypothetical protein